MRFWSHALPIVFALSVLAGCSALLPRSQQASQTPWRDYDEAQSTFARIEPGKTTRAGLSALGIGPANTPNVVQLSHADLLRHLSVATGADLGLLDPELRRCLADYHSCHALQLHQSRLERKRVGNFWLDILNFRRHVEVSGWNFDALLVLRGDVVVYKMWSGNPLVQQTEDERNPLGPLQGIGNSVFR